MRERCRRRSGKMTKRNELMEGDEEEKERERENKKRTYMERVSVDCVFFFLLFCFIIFSPHVCYETFLIEGLHSNLG